MRFISALVFVLSVSSLASATDYFLNLGESIRLGQNNVYCGQGGGLPSCQETCEHYDSFHGTCQYQTKCEIEDKCIKKTSCERWDSFKETCNSERVDFLCRNNFTCTESCQRFDSFNNTCTYKSDCEALPNGCFKKTVCDRFDAFDGRCVTERKDIICP